MKLADIGDIPALVEMAERFHGASAMPFEFSAEKLTELFRGLIASGAVFKTDKGFIAGTLAPAYAGDWLVAIEMMWWAEDRQGLSLLRKFEEWAKEQGADEVRMTSLAQMPEAGTILSRRGYEAAEISHRKLI
tara:strand:- start:323 stop:721 length:399 start_codon:yes stop_codon:yes gene_type:complete